MSSFDFSVIMDASELCNIASFDIGSAGATRQWDIKGMIRTLVDKFVFSLNAILHFSHSIWLQQHAEPWRWVTLEAKFEINPLSFYFLQKKTALLIYCTKSFLRLFDKKKVKCRGSIRKQICRRRWLSPVFHRHQRRNRQLQFPDHNHPSGKHKYAIILKNFWRFD